MVIRNSLDKIHRALRLYSTKFPELDSQFNSLGGLIEAETAFKGSTGTARVPVQSGSLNHVYRELGTLLEKVRVRMNNHRR
jgi:hypothetical protein